MLTSVTLIVNSHQRTEVVPYIEKLAAVERALLQFGALETVAIRGGWVGLSPAQCRIFDMSLPALHREGVLYCSSS